MDRKYIDDNHLVARYLADQLPDAEREAFEAYCRENPELFREMEATARFKTGLAKLGNSGRLQPMLDSAVSRRFAFRRAAMVAGLTIGALALYAGYVSLRAPVMGATVAAVSSPFGRPSTVVRSFDVYRTRDPSGSAKRIVLPTGDGAIALRVYPETSGDRRYRAVLRRLDGPSPVVAGETGALIPDASHFVTVYLDLGRLSRGNYDLELTVEGAADVESRSRFRIRFE